MSSRQDTEALDRLPETMRAVTSREQAVRNSLFIRQVNERIAELSDSWLDAEPGDLLCECGDESCIQVISVTRADYQLAREHSGCYLVASDHAEDAGTYVRTSRDGYSIVEYRALPEMEKRSARTTHPRA